MIAQLKHLIGIADTTFARVDLAKFAIEWIQANLSDVKFLRYTVPGVKDLPVAVKKLLDSGCEATMAIGMPGGEPIDKQCAHEASLGIIMAQLMTNKHVLEVFVHADEAEDDQKLYTLAVERVRKHAQNLVLLLQKPEALTRQAGMGKRQGAPDVGPIKI